MNIYGKTYEDLVTHIRTHRCYCLDNPCEFHVFNSTYCGDTKNTQNCPFRFPDDDPLGMGNTGDTGDIESAPLAEDAYTPTTPTDNVNHPSHYCKGGIECLEAIKASMSDKGFTDYLKGNIIKYLWRYENKGKPVEDLKKAQFYLNRLIKEVEGDTQ